MSKQPLFVIWFLLAFMDSTYENYTFLLSQLKQQSNCAEKTIQRKGKGYGM